MALLYADEQFPYPVVEYLRALDHDVLTVKEAGRDNQKISDSEVLAFATEQGRAVITQNRKDFFQLHRAQPNHAGIIACTCDRNWEQLAKRIDAAISNQSPIQGKLIRVYRPGSVP